MSDYSTASENHASDASPTPLPIPIPSSIKVYAIVPPGWGGLAWTNAESAHPADSWQEGATTRWDTPSPDSWSPIVPPEPLVALLDTPISPAPLPSPLLLPAPPPSQVSPAPSPIPQETHDLANQILEAMENGSDKENVPPRLLTPHPDAPHSLQRILLDIKVASRVLFEVIAKESAVLMDLLETFHNIAYTPDMGDSAAHFRINLMVDLALRLLQNGIELILYNMLRCVDWEINNIFEYIREDQECAELARPFLSSSGYHPPVLHRATEEYKECLSAQKDVLSHCSKLQTKLEQETRALAAILYHYDRMFSHRSQQVVN
ncbi:hypothetical protein JOM56_013708 [Amanita muscaria]